MIRRPPRSSLFPNTTLFLFFFNDTATTELYTLPLHDALPISRAWARRAPRYWPVRRAPSRRPAPAPAWLLRPRALASTVPASAAPRAQRPPPQVQAAPAAPVEADAVPDRSEEHTAELQSHLKL